MQSKIKQNIVSACYNDSLTVQQISLETGVPLPYLDDEIKELEDKQIILRNGNHYTANVIIITSECADEIERAAAKYHEMIADKTEAFLRDKKEEYKKIGFIGCDFSENTLCWQLAAIPFPNCLRCGSRWMYKRSENRLGRTRFPLACGKAQ